MWPFPKRVDASALALVDQLHGVTLRINQLTERLEALEAAHERLRGRFYATGAHRQPPDREPTKGELLAQAGFVPGKPFPHK